MMSEFMMKKSKGVMEQRDHLGVMTRSKIRALQRVKKDGVGGESLQLGSRRVDKLGVGSGEVKKKQRRGASSSLGKGKGKGKKVGGGGGGGGGRKMKKEKGKGKVKEKEKGKVDKEEMGGVDFVESGDLGGIGGGLSGIGGGSAEVGDVGVGVGVFVMDGSGDAAFGGVFGAVKGGGDETAMNTDGVDNFGIGGGDDATAGVDAGDRTAAIGGEGAELGGDVAGGDDRVIRESTPEHLIIRSDYSTTPCSSILDPKAVADERPQTGVGGNPNQHMKLTTDMLFQDNSNYAPSMEKYNFDFENEKPLFGRYEWEKVQP